MELLEDRRLLSAHGHGGKPGGGGSGGGPGGGSGGGPGTFYPTAANVAQLIADINYADTVGGTFTVNLQPNTTFDLGNVANPQLPVVGGGTKTVNLTILGNGDTIERPATADYQVRLFQVASGTSLTLSQMTLKGGYTWASDGGAIYNLGTLTISDCTLSGNTAFYSGYISSLQGGRGGAIYNHGTATISNSILSGNSATGRQAYGGAIYNDFGTLTIADSTLSGNVAGGDSGDVEPFGAGGAIYNNNGKVTISHSALSGNAASYYGGGIYNAAGGTLTVQNFSSITGNLAGYVGADADNLGVLYLDGTSTIGLLNGNAANLI